ARAVARDATGAASVALPPAQAGAYGAADAGAVFAVRDAAGRLVAAQPAGFGELVARWPAAGDDPEFFRLSRFGPAARDYHGLTIRLDSAAGPVSIAVA